MANLETRRLLGELYSDGSPEIVGKIEGKPKGTLKRAFRKAKGQVIGYLLDHGLEKYVNALKRDIPLYVRNLRSDDNGIEQAYTNGREIGVNEKVIPGTDLYSRLMDRLESSRNPFSRYLYKKLSRPAENLSEALAHELHHLYQIESGFDRELYHATREYVRERLPKHIRPFADHIAMKLTVDMLEGVTEASTLQSEGLSYRGALKKLENDPSTYAALGRRAISSIRGMPDKLYKGGREALDNFVSSFLSPGYA